MTRLLYRPALLLICLLTTVSGESGDLRCETKENCDDCLKTFECVWCTDKSVTDNQCMTLDNAKAKCNNAYYDIESKREMIENNFKITTRLHRTETITYKIKPADFNNYALDLYFLIDYSRSMKLIRDTLIDNIDDIVDGIKNVGEITYGLGSFIDKSIMPYVNRHPKKLTNPCSSEPETCVPAYSFINHLSLQKNSSSVIHTELKESKFSGNTDRPEGVFDALLQAILCSKEIGWRDKARKIIVLLTDGEYHVAGDGRVAGIVMPYDMKCHMENNTYVKATEFDYPSIGQIIDAVEQNDIKLLIITTETYTKVYDQLTNQISFSKTLVFNANISSSIIEYYKSITDNIGFEPNAEHNDAIDCKIDIAECPSQKQCNRTIYEELTVTVSLTPTKCVHNNVNISASFTSKFLSIDVSVLCDCQQCTMNDQANSPECSHRGNLTCGTCQCEQGWTGSSCECDPKVGGNQNEVGCKDQDVICSDHGECTCGKCECTDEYYGDFCQCSDSSCGKVEDQLCGGHGQCKCNECKCEDDFYGETCECNDSSCRNPESNSSDASLCSGNGKCNCGVCECTNSKYAGTYCDQCPLCLYESCHFIQTCTEAFVKDETRSGECVNFTILEDADSIAETPCKFSMDNCVIYPRVVLDGRTISFRKSCSMEAGALGALIALTLLIALLIPLGVWKLWARRQDKLNWKKFEKQQGETTWIEEQNPLFKSAETTVVNPMYTGN